MSISYEERALWYDTEQTLLDDTSYLQAFVGREGSSVLEIPCASGRNIAWLGGLNQRVVLADLSLRMLDVCQAKINKLGLNIQTLVADMEAIQLAQKVDTTIVPQDGFLLLSGPTTMLKALRSIRENLSIGGRALIDVPLLDKCKRTVQSSPHYFDVEQAEDVEVFEWSRRLPNGNMLLRWRTQRKLIHSNQYRLQFRYEVRGPEEQPLGVYNSVVELAIVSVDSMTELVSASGFQIETIHQNYEGDNLTEDACRVIFQLRR